MENINQYVGSRIRSHRKSRGLTLQALADAIHKSRATVSKYETGEISLDIQTLHDISQVLEVPLSRLADCPPAPAQPPVSIPGNTSRSPFFQAETLYFYFFDGRYNRLKDGVIRIRKKDGSQGDAALTISSISSSGRSSEVLYEGRVVYSDMLIRFSFVNQYNSLEEDLLYIFNPLELRDFTEGLLCGISSADLMPCAFKCLVTLSPQAPTEELKQHLLLTPAELRRWQKLNMLIVDNH